MTDGDPGSACGRALRRSAAGAGCPIELVADRATPWWSATFAGHRLAFTAAATADAALDGWLSALPELDLPIPGRLVADVAVDRIATVGQRARITLSLLVLDAD